jgi:large subunit ribosomal protein L13
MKTYSQKPAEVSRKWYVVDASGVSLGRIATNVAGLLIGKGKPTVTSHVDGGDYVVIINAEKMVATGNKAEKKIYYNHSGYPGGLRARQLKDVKSSEALYQAVRGMIPVNKLRDGRLARLKVYDGAEHNHSAQKPETYELKGAK